MHSYQTTDHKEGWVELPLTNCVYAHYLKNHKWLCDLPRWDAYSSIKYLTPNTTLPHCKACERRLAILKNLEGETTATTERFVRKTFQCIKCSHKWWRKFDLDNPCKLMDNCPKCKFQYKKFWNELFQDFTVGF
jgi:hypothetical protein